MRCGPQRIRSESRREVRNCSAGRVRQNFGRDSVGQDSSRFAKRRRSGYVAAVPFSQNISDQDSVNNAGYVLGVEHVGDIKDADIEGMFATNVLGLISVTQLLVRRAFPSSGLKIRTEIKFK